MEIAELYVSIDKNENKSVYMGTTSAISININIIDFIINGYEIRLVVLWFLDAMQKTIHLLFYFYTTLVI